MADLSIHPAQRPRKQQAPPLLGTTWAQPAPQPAAWPLPDLNDPVLGLGFALSRQYLGPGLEATAASKDKMSGHLKAEYFNVTNSYCLAKLSLLLFPYRTAPWRVPVNRDEGKPVLAPDLYLPLMALSTYVLVVGLAKESASSFTPEVIIEVFSFALVCHALQVLAMQLALYLTLPGSTLPWLDLVALTGYQYIGLAANMGAGVLAVWLAGVLIGARIYYACLAWTAASTGFVLYKTLGRVVNPSPLLPCVVLQVVSMWFMGYTGELFAERAVGDD